MAASCDDSEFLKKLTDLIYAAGVFLLNVENDVPIGDCIVRLWLAMRSRAVVLNSRLTTVATHNWRPMWGLLSHNQLSLLLYVKSLRATYFHHVDPQFSVATVANCVSKTCSETLLQVPASAIYLSPLTLRAHFDRTLLG